MSFGTFMKENQVFTTKLPKMIQNLKKESIRITVKSKNFKSDHKNYRIYFIKRKPRLTGKKYADRFLS